MDSSSGPLYVFVLPSNVLVSMPFQYSKTSPPPDVYDRSDGTYMRLTSAVGCSTTGTQSLECLRSTDFQACFLPDRQVYPLPVTDITQKPTDKSNAMMNATLNP